MIPILLVLTILGGAMPSIGLEPAAASDAPGNVQITDPRGDAYEESPDAAFRRANSGCDFVEPEGGSACANVSRTLAGAPDGPEAGPPAPPSLDMLRVWFDDTPTTLDVTIEVASLSANYDESYPPQRKQPLYFACWTMNDAICNQMVYAFIKRDLSGNAIVEASLGVWGGCNAWDWCDWKIDGRIEPGTPGRVIITVPRALLAEPDAASVEKPFASTDYFDGRTYEYFGSYGLTAPGIEQRENFESLIYIVDETNVGDDYAYRTPRVAEPIATAAWTPSAPGMHSGPQMDEIDILGVGIVDNETTLTVEVQIAKLQLPGATRWFDLYLGAPDGSVVWTGVSLEGEDVDVYGVVCEQAAEAPQDCSLSTRDIMVDVDVRQGTPGTLAFHFARADIGKPKAGEMLKLLAADSGDIEAQRVANENVEGVVVYADRLKSVDWYGYSYPWRFTVDTNVITSPTTVLRDPVGDANVPAGIIESGAMYDITYLQAEGTGPGLSRITMGLEDLSRVIVPQGYAGVLYAAAIETETGAYMAGYHKSSQNNDGGKFFCAPDVDVFTGTKRNPTEVVWQEITGVVTLARTAQGGQGGGTSGSITFNVPNSCLGDPDAETITATRMGAGTYLIPSVSTPGASITEVDAVHGDSAPLMGAASIPAPGSPWWADDRFWNILGVAIALGGGAVALAARKRRRSAVEREMRAIEEAHAKHRAAPAAWRLAMTQRRTHAAGLLRRGKLRPDEVLVIERRIDLLAQDLPPEPPAAPREVEVGVTIDDRYRVERLLGEGGQGRALLARDDKLTRQVVLKTVRTADMDPRTKRALLAEARLAGSLDHPNVVRVHDVIENPHSAIIVMEFVPGGTLRGRLRREGRLAPAEAVRLLTGVLDGLATAHARGIVHRDVKPENVLLAKDGTPKLSDFGAATEERPDATVRAVAAGTLAYMSPEQVRGAQADARSDLYAAGAMLHELLTGETYLPLAGLDDFLSRAAILEREPELKLPDEALAYSGFLLRALAKDPSARFQNAHEMATALRRVQ